MLAKSGDRKSAAGSVSPNESVSVAFTFAGLYCLLMYNSLRDLKWSQTDLVFVLASLSHISFSLLNRKVPY